jgi:flagellar hook-associated protein 3 FlgL
MRINPNIMPDLLAALAKSQDEQNTAMMELSSGRRVSKPSDDPSAAAVLVRNHADSTQDTQYLSTMTTLQSMLQTADSTLSSVVTTLQRAISLGVEGATGTMSSSDRAAVVQELQGIRDQLVSMANAAYQGRFIFAGTANGSRPFTVDGAQPSGVRYDGNSQTNQVTIGEGYALQVNVPGSDIFRHSGADVFQSLQELITGLQNNTATDTAVSQLRNAFDNVTAQRVFYGNALNQIQSQQNYLNNEKLQLSQQEDAVGGADFAAAATRLLTAQNARDATLNVVGRTAQMNLFDYLR